MTHQWQCTIITLQDTTALQTLKQQSQRRLSLNLYGAEHHHQSTTPIPHHTPYLLYCTVHRTAPRHLVAKRLAQTVNMNMLTYISYILLSVQSRSSEGLVQLPLTLLYSASPHCSSLLRHRLHKFVRSWFCQSGCLWSANGPR